MGEEEELDFTGVVAELRDNFDKGVLKTVESRISALKRLHTMLEETEEEMYEAFHKDLRKSRTEAELLEVMQVRVEIGNCIKDLPKWVKPERVSTDLLNKFTKCEIRKDPLGVILIIGTWNYPLLSSLMPLIGAIAAGNCAVVKPSEVGQNFGKLLAKVIPKYTSQDYVRLISGGIPVSTALLKQRFDHIMFTGSPAVGRIVMAAASKYLTPVTLEMGGKCPAIVDHTCDFDVVGQRMAWGKFVNAGQSCLGIDYVLCIGDCKEKLTIGLKTAIEKFYGNDPKTSDSYGRIINARHLQRIVKLINQSKVVFGGASDENDLYIYPTIMHNVTEEDLVMQEEIFGPLLPIIDVESVDDAIKFVNKREKPLALYVFSKDYKTTEAIVDRTSSGSVCINDAIVQISVPGLPFGGVGESGLGAYSGKASYDCFTHRKSYMHKNQSFEKINGIRYPPYNTDSKVLNWGKWLLTPKVKK